MIIPGSQCNAKVLRPERCEVLDDKPCSACTEDIELEKEITGELEHSIEKLQSRHHTLRTVMNENHDHLIQKFPPEIVSHILFHIPPQVLRDKNGSTATKIGVPHYALDLCARNGGSWPEQCLSFDPPSS